MPSSTLVISEIFGGGGNSGAPYSNDYIEIHNISTEPLDLSGFSVQYASATGVTWQVTPLSGTIPAKGFFLVQEAMGAGSGSPLPTPDNTGTIAMSSTSGKVALVQGTTALTGQKPSSNQIVDIVSYGTANSTEGNPASAASNTQSVMRIMRGDQDTDNNSADFASGAPDPQNSQAEATCYATGTLIRTARGDFAVENLAVGDVAVTTSGEHRPIRWIGSRLTHCRRHSRPHEVMPVRVSAHAFGADRPARDLVVSPGHALCVDVVGEVLIPAGVLVNGTTIAQEDVDTVTYWHVELEGGHDILLAENMPAESYIEMGNRGFFAESDVVDFDASPNAPVVTHADFCRPFHADGALVEVVRAQLAARAERLGWRFEEQGLGDLHLLVDGVRVEPRVRGLCARFTVPASAAAVWLVSGTTVPAEIAVGSPDRRALGLCVAAINLDDGFGAPRAVALDDARLCVGFHAVERDGDTALRWTAGRARLPASLWEGLEDDTFLRVDLAGPALPRWVAPAAAVANVEPLRLMA